MSRFYGDLQGNRGVATRQGTPKSGIHSHIRGWNAGVNITGYVNENDQDCFDIHSTGGSNHPGNREFLGTITILNDKIIFTK